MIEENIFYIVQETGTNFTVNPHAKILPILWCQDGEYRVFPKEVLANAINATNMYADHYSEKTDIFKPTHIYWEQGILVNNLVGRALSGE